MFDKKHDPDGPPAYPAVEKPLAGPSTSVMGAGSGPHYACVHLARSDRIRLLGFPADVRAPVGEAVTRVWRTGVQKQFATGSGGYEWKLSGNPWYGQGAEAVPCRRLIVHVLHALASAGWHLLVSSDLSKKTMDKDSLFFRSGPPVQRYFFSVSFNESDKIRLIDSPNQEVTAAFLQCIRSHWGLGVQDVKEKELNCTQVKLRGTPWWTSNGDQVDATRLLICALLGLFEQQGFELVGSVDLSSSGGDQSYDLDSWFFASKLM